MRGGELLATVALNIVFCHVPRVLWLSGKGVLGAPKGS